MPVPNTNTFSLQDVCDAIAGAQDDLVECFAEATAGAFDPTYGSITDNDMLAFRNYDEGGAAPFLTISPASFGAPASAGSFPLSISSNQSWAYSDDAVWLSGSPTSGTGNGTVTVSYTANGGITRYGVITITTTTGSPTIIRNCNVEQAGTGGAA